MIGKKLQEQLNQQVNTELQSAYLYFSIASYFDHKSLDGFSHWMKEQAQEEIAHAMRIYRYLTDRGVHCTMLPIPQPQSRFDSPLHAFQAALEQERTLGRELNELASTALEERDNTTYSFLEWFLAEQVEEVATVSAIVDKLQLIGDNGHGILMLNNELGARKGPVGEPAA